MDGVRSSADDAARWMRVSHAALRLRCESPHWAREHAALQTRRDTCFSQAVRILLKILLILKRWISVCVNVLNLSRLNDFSNHGYLNLYLLLIRRWIIFGCHERPLEKGNRILNLISDQYSYRRSKGSPGLFCKHTMKTKMEWASSFHQVQFSWVHQIQTSSHLDVNCHSIFIGLTLTDHDMVTSSKLTRWGVYRITLLE